MSVYNISKTIVRFFNGKYVEKNIDKMIAIWGGISLCTVAYIYYFHFTKGIDYKVNQKMGQQLGIIQTWVNDPLTYDEINRYQLYCVANAPR